MKVKVVRSECKDLWYNDQINAVFAVEEELACPGWYRLLGEHGEGARLLQVMDVEIVEEEQLTLPLKVKCVDNEFAESILELGKIYVAKGSFLCTDYILEGVNSSWSKRRFEIVEGDNVQDFREVGEQEERRTIDSHYNFDYVLTEKDREYGTIKIDPYFVAKQWRLGSKDDTGVLFHCLKNISRYSDKNTKEREIKALYLQIKRLAELEGVSLNEMVLEILNKS